MNDRSDLCLERLTLTDFRNYPRLVWAPQSRLAVITGPNGSGKTNLLEAISLLAPGRGLRAARLADLPRRGSAGGWGVAARFSQGGRLCELGTAAQPGAADASERRLFRLNGQAPRNQAEIAESFAAVWLTPQMDRLFQEGASGRRRFLDRLVWALDPNHARETASHDRAMTQRNRLLARGGADPAWLAGLEDSMARHAVAATASRLALTGRLNTVLATGESLGAFPRARLDLICPIGERLATSPALAAEEWLRAALAERRSQDAAAGMAGMGAHRADMALAEQATGLPAAQASTGQQKAMLIATVLGHASLITDARGFAPLLLLDEPLVHLDRARRDALFAAMASMTAQVLLTGTEALDFAPLRGDARHWIAGDGGLRRDPP